MTARCAVRGARRSESPARARRERAGERTVSRRRGRTSARGRRPAASPPRHGSGLPSSATFEVGIPRVVAEYRPHPTVLGWKSVGNGRSAVGVRREPPSARVFRCPVFRPSSDLVGCGRTTGRDLATTQLRPSSDRTRTYSETQSKIDRSQVSIPPPPTVIRPFTTVFTSSSDRHPTGIEHGRMMSKTPGRQCPPSLLRPCSAPLPTVFHPRTVG